MPHRTSNNRLRSNQCARWGGWGSEWSEMRSHAPNLPQSRLKCICSWHGFSHGGRTYERQGICGSSADLRQAGRSFSGALRLTACARQAMGKPVRGLTTGCQRPTNSGQACPGPGPRPHAHLPSCLRPAQSAQGRARTTHVITYVLKSNLRNSASNAYTNKKVAPTC